MSVLGCHSSKSSKCIFTIMYLYHNSVSSEARFRLAGFRSMSTEIKRVRFGFLAITIYPKTNAPVVSVNEV